VRARPGIYNKSMLRMSSDDAISILRAHEPELKAAGVRSLKIFGSVARGEAGPESDIDLEAEFENVDALTLLDIAKLERHLSGLLGRRVELIQHGTLKDGIRERVEAEAVLAF
jgi:predicted nucleotidyltransferase